MATPKLRFKEFEEDYKELTVSELFDFYSTNSLSRDKLNAIQGEYKNIHYGDIHVKYPTILDVNLTDIPYINDDVDISNFTLCKNGDLIMADASEDYNDIGKSVELVNIKNDDKIITGLHTLHIRAKNEVFALGYKGFLFKSELVRKQIKTLAAGAKVLGISKGNLQKVLLSIPTQSEQKKIADFLSLLDRKIALQEKKIALLKDYKKGVLHLIFSKNSDFQYKEIGEFAEVYQPKTISLDDCKYGGDYSVYGANGLIGYYRDYNHELEQVTISCRGENSGTVNFIPPFSWITGNSMVINLDQATNILKKFVCYSLQYENLKSIVSGSGQPQIIRKDVLNFKIKVTNIKKQQEIIECLEKIELKIINQRNKEVALKAIKNSLLQQMFI